MGCPTASIFGEVPPPRAPASRERTIPATPDPTRKLEERFHGALLEDPELVPHGSHVLVAFSGGPDSTALLHLLDSAADDLELSLSAAHFDHGLRPGSDDVAAAARATCQEIGVSCQVGRAENLSGGQAQFREARYRFLTRAARRAGAIRIALGHQMDDHLETVLLRLLRGTGVRGLAGIPTRRGPFVRPLLGFRRDELQAYLSGAGRSWIDDPSNADPRFARPRVRHDLMPRLTAAGGQAVGEVLSQIALDADRVDVGLEARAASLLARARLEPPEGTRGAQIARSPMRAYDPADQARILRKLARDMGFRLGRRGTAAGVEFVDRGASGHAVDVAGGLRVSREYDRIHVGPVEEVPEDLELEISGPSAGADRLMLGGRGYGVHWGVLKGAERWIAQFPVGRLRFPLRLRAPRPGDRIRTAVGSRKIKKLLNEKRVPRSQRPCVPLLVESDHSVLWVAGHQLAAYDPPDPNEEMFRIGVGED